MIDYTVNQQILAAIKFGVSQNKVIWRLLNLASLRGLSMQCTIDMYVGVDQRWVQVYSYSNVLVLISTFRVLSTRTRVLSSNCHKYSY